MQPPPPPRSDPYSLPGEPHEPRPPQQAQSPLGYGPPPPEYLAPQHPQYPPQYPDYAQYPQYPPQYPPPGYAPPGYAPPGYAPPGYGQSPYYSPPPYYGARQWQPPKPGCVPLRPLGLGEILDGSFQVVRRNPRTTLGLSAVVAVVSGLLGAGFEFYFNRLDLGAPSGSAQPSAGELVSEASAGFSVLVLGTLLGAMLTGMLAAVVTEDVLGVKLTIGQAWARARRRIWALFGLSLVITIAEVVGLAFCIAPGVWLWGIWAVAVPAMMVEGTSVFGSLGRSRQLVRGTFWRVWGIRALGTLLVSVVSGFISGPLTAIGLVVGGYQLGQQHVSNVFIVFTAIGSILSATITAPVRSAIDALLYVDLRMRKEGLDLELQQRATHLARPVGA